MNKSQEPNKLAVFFSLACQDGNFDSFKKAYAKCRLMDHSYLVLILISPLINYPYRKPFILSIPPQRQKACLLCSSWSENSSMWIFKIR